MTEMRQRRAAIQAARSVAPTLAGRAAEAERNRTLPSEVVEELRAAGLFRLLLPNRLGGLELDPVTVVEVIEELSRADGSAGWTVLIGNSTAFFSWLDPDVAGHLIGCGPDFVAAAMFGPTGQATLVDDDSVVVDGRWSFVSGAPHADWFQLGVFVMDGGQPRMLEDGSPDWRFAYLHRDHVVVEDTWNPAGLRGTGSHHVSVSGAQIPLSQLAAPFRTPARQEGPLWQLPFFTLVGLSMAGFPLGVARRALDEITQLATVATRGGLGAPIASDEHAQVELSRVEGAVHAARVFVLDVASDLWTTVNAGAAPTIEQRCRCSLAVQHAMRTAVDAVDVAFRFAGASVVQGDHPLQRCFRDVHVASQHIYFSSDAQKRYARFRLGIDQPLSML